MRTSDQPYVVIERQPGDSPSRRAGFWYTEEGNELRTDRIVAAGDAAACMAAWRLLTGNFEAHL